MLIFLVGYMGCGKSSTGRKIARRLGMGFTDMDAEIEEREGMKITEIFAAKGEPYFRRLERETLTSYAHAGDWVVATGGGVPCHGDNMELMNSLGVTVYFRMTPRKLVRRLGPGRAKRPLICGKDDAQLLEFIEANLPLREPFYSRAKLVIDCDGVNDEYIVRHVETFIKITNNEI